MTGIINILLGILLFAMSFFSTSASALDQASFNRLVNAGISPQALREALKAYAWADSHGEVHKHILTLVDFTKPSVKKRLWVIDMNNVQVLYNGLVAHGKGSGDLYATHFSNKPGSEASVLG